MELRYLEMDGILLPLPQEVGNKEDSNQDVVARVSEMIEHMENAEASYVALSTSGSF